MPYDYDWFDEWLDEAYGTDWMAERWGVGHVIRYVDPVMFRTGHLETVDSIQRDRAAEDPDYEWVDDIEEVMDEDDYERWLDDLPNETLDSFSPSQVLKTLDPQTYESWYAEEEDEYRRNNAHEYIPERSVEDLPQLEVGQRVWWADEDDYESAGHPVTVVGIGPDEGEDTVVTIRDDEYSAEDEADDEVYLWQLHEYPQFKVGDYVSWSNELVQAQRGYGMITKVNDVVPWDEYDFPSYLVQLYDGKTFWANPNQLTQHHGDPKKWRPPEDPGQTSLFNQLG